LCGVLFSYNNIINEKLENVKKNIGFAGFVYASKYVE